MNIGFIGGGVMGEAIIRSILSKKVVKPDDIIVSDISEHRLSYLYDQYRVKITRDNMEVPVGTDVIFLSIKPAEMSTVLPQLRPLKAEQLVISIAAGISLEKLKCELQHDRIVRSMPNMPAQIGAGITVWTSTPEVTEEQREITRRLLSSLGEELYVAAEKYIDIATALSGSGPAYIFLIAEALIDAGVHIGLPRNMAEKLVQETIIGSGRALKELKDHPAALRNKVTSPGGTTSEALLKLETGGIRSIMLHAVIAAYEKSQYLGSK